MLIGYGVGGRPTFWLGTLTSGELNWEIHIAFGAVDRAAVRAFFDAAVAAGAEVLDEPGCGTANSRHDGTDSEL